MHAPLAATVLEILGVVGVIVLLVLVAGVTFFAYQIFRLRRAMAAAMRTMPDVLAQLAEASRRAAGEAEAASARATSIGLLEAEDQAAFLRAAGWTPERWAEEGDRVLFVTDDLGGDDLVGRLQARLGVVLDDATACDLQDRIEGLKRPNQLLARATFAEWLSERSTPRLERIATWDDPEPTDAYVVK